MIFTWVTQNSWYFFSVDLWLLPVYHAICAVFCAKVVSLILLVQICHLQVICSKPQRKKIIWQKSNCDVISSVIYSSAKALEDIAMYTTFPLQIAENCYKKQYSITILHEKIKNYKQILLQCNSFILNLKLSFSL